MMKKLPRMSDTNLHIGWHGRAGGFYSRAGSLLLHCVLIKLKSHLFAKHFQELLYVVSFPTQDSIYTQSSEQMDIGLKANLLLLLLLLLLLE